MRVLTREVGFSDVTGPPPASPQESGFKFSASALGLPRHDPAGPPTRRLEHCPARAGHGGRCPSQSSSTIIMMVTGTSLAESGPSKA